MRIIIALDILEGKCVRLTKGDYSTIKVYNENPLEVARKIADHGLEFVHIADLDGAKSKHIVNYRMLEKISSITSLKVDFGGGLRSYDDLKIAFNSGASQVTCGSAAVTDPVMFLEWLAKWGADSIILGADCKDRIIASQAWVENSGPDIIEFISDYRSKGVKYTICTDIDRDGMMQGPSTSLYKEILEIPGINLIASGGITSIRDIEELSEAGCEGAIIGKALYEGILNLKELSRLC